MSPRMTIFRGERGEETAETETGKFEPFVRTCGASANQAKKAVKHIFRSKFSRPIYVQE